MNKQYDYLIVGAGLYGSVFAYRARKAGKKVMVIDKRSYPGGNIYCENIQGIQVHKYGAHIFHTSDKNIWDFVNSFVEFNRFTNSPLANYKGKLYNLPFNMNTFYALWGTQTPQEARERIEQQKQELSFTEPSNLEEQALSLVGRDIYEILIKEYTEKQWGRPCSELPAFIIRRLPVRFTYDNNYFNDRYQGIPVGGYNRLIDGLLKDIPVSCDTDFFADRTHWENVADQIVFTGSIDEYFGYCFGHLEYRSLRFEEELLEYENYQGNAVINYTSLDVPYTRIIEHKHFATEESLVTVITREYPCGWEPGTEPYYPINDSRNEQLYKRYKELAGQKNDVVFGGRLAEYKYYDMDKVIASALDYSFD